MTKVRFAPSPTGKIHIGNARPALMNWLFAKSQSGTYVLRYDDTDLARSTKEFADGIAHDLAWLGVIPDEEFRQSDRFAQYDVARDNLIAQGRLYPCYETPEELDRRRSRARAMGRPPIYDRAALELTKEQIEAYEAEGRTPHWRFKLKGDPVQFTDLVRGAQTVNTASMSDPVLVRADGSYLYTLPSVVDDIDSGITHIIRGEDHISNTGVQIELFEALEATAPIFGHHNLLTDAEGKGLSKRLGSLSISELRDQGFEPQAVAAMATLTGTSLPVEPFKEWSEIASQFSFDKISHGPARYDERELESLNSRILHGTDFQSLAPRLAELGVTDEVVWDALKANLVRLKDIADWTKLIDGPIEPVIADEDREFISEAVKLLPAEPWSQDTWGEWTKAVKAESGRKGKTLFMPLRLALTGRADGPELKNLLPLIGYTASQRRLA